MANTTNLNLSKLSGTEKLKTFPTPYSDNMDAIDGAFGAGFGVSGKPTVNAEINSLADGLAIISNNNTHAAITAGQFVYVRGHGSLSDGLYVATANIAANGTLSGSNLTADTAGGLNSVYSSLNSKIESSTSAELGVYDNRVKNVSSTEPAIVTKRGNVCVVSGYIEYLVSPTSYQSSILTIPNGYMPVSNIYTTVVRASDGKAFVAQVSLSSGYVNIYNRGEISTGDKFYLGITYVI